MYKHAFAAAFITSILFALGFFVPYVGEALVLVGFAPLLIYLSKEQWSYKKSFFFFFFSGVLFFGITLIWMFSLLPLEWAGVESASIAYALFVSAWLLVVCSFALWWGVFGAGVAYLSIWMGSHSWNLKILYALSIAGLWVLCEYARSFVIGFWGFASGSSSFFSEWTLGSLVYGMTDGWVVLLASVGGIYLVNLVIIISNVLVFLWWSTASTKKKRVFGGAVILAGVMGVASLGGVFFVKWHERANRSARSYEVVAMRTDIPRAFVYAQSDRAASLRASIGHVVALPQAIDILVAPEDGDMLSFDALNGMRLIDRMKKNNTLLVDHVYTRQANGVESRTLYWRPDGGIVGFQGKHILMPIGEYVPFVVGSILSLLGYQHAVGTYEDARALAVAEKGPPVTDVRGTYASIVCSEASNPNMVRSLGKNGADVIFLQASDTLFRGNYLYARYMISMARVRAIESGRFVVRASNAGPTAIIDSVGHVRALRAGGSEGVAGQVPFLHIVTPYARWGAWPVPLAGVLLALGLLYRRYPQ